MIALVIAWDVLRAPVTIWAQRFRASARAGSYLGPWGGALTFRADVIDQRGVGQLMPVEARPSFWLVPVVIVAAALGMGLALA